MSGLWRRLGVLGPAGLSSYGTTYVRPGVTEDGGMGHCRQPLHCNEFHGQCRTGLAATSTNRRLQEAARDFQTPSQRRGCVETPWHSKHQTGSRRES